MNPSLLLIPDRYKASKLYSQIPDSGAGDLAFTRANDTATRVNSQGLIEKVRTNVCLYSEQVDNAWWGKARVTITANATTNPIDGASTADKIVADSTPSVSHDIGSSAITVTGSIIYVVSAYFKKAEYDFAVLGGSAAAQKAWFNLNTGVKGSQGGSVLAYDMVDAGNGWYRCFVAILTTSGSFSVEATIANVDGSRVISGVASGGIFCFGFQLESGDVMTPYIPTTTAAVSVGPVANIPRIDYTGGGCGKLLLEPQRTNVLTFSEQINNATWNKINVSVSANQAAAPDGTTSADLIYPTTTGDNRLIEQFFTAGAGQTWTTSFFVKASGFSWVIIYSPTGGGASWFNASTGVFGTIAAGSTAAVLGQVNGFWRISITATLAGTNTYFYAGPADANGTTTATANGTNGLLLWGCQLELGSYVSSYIPTLGASVTRSADAASKTGISSLIGQTEGTIYWEGSGNATIGGADLWMAAISVNDTSVAVLLYYIASTQTVNVFINNGVTSVILDSPMTLTQVNKVAVAYKNSEFALYLNGALVDSSSSAIAPPTGMNQFAFVKWVTAANQDRALVDSAALYTTRLSNADLQTLTTL